MKASASAKILHKGGGKWSGRYLNITLGMATCHESFSLRSRRHRTSDKKNPSLRKGSMFQSAVTVPRQTSCESPIDDESERT